MHLNLYEDLIRETSSFYTYEVIKNGLDLGAIMKRDSDVCFLRHDIDYSPENALRMAEVEIKNSVKSTYTVLLTGQYYNPFEKSVKKNLREIVELGHEVGLHFDPTVHDIQDEENLDRFIRQEAAALEDLLGTRVDMFSFHNTSDFSMSCENYEYGDRINVYSSSFKKNIQYTSDSNGYWRFRSWKQLLLERHKAIQVLTHPIWWASDYDYPPLETIVRSILARADNCVSEYLHLFSGQSTRENRSMISNQLEIENLRNNEKILRAYCQSPKLHSCLRDGDPSDLLELKSDILAELDFK